MQTISYRGDELDCEVVLRRPTVRDGVLTEILSRKLDEAKQEGTLIPELTIHAAYFVVCVTCVASSRGLPFAIPGLTATTADILKCFYEWTLLPDDLFVTKWYNAALAVREIDFPKAKRSENNAPTRSKGRRVKSQQQGKES